MVRFNVNLNGSFLGRFSLRVTCCSVHLTTLSKARNASHCSFSISRPSHTAALRPVCTEVLPEHAAPSRHPTAVCLLHLSVSQQPFHDCVTSSRPARSHGADLDPTSPEHLLHAKCCCSVVNQPNPTAASRGVHSSWEERLQDTLRSN